MSAIANENFLIALSLILKWISCAIFLYYLICLTNNWNSCAYKKIYVNLHKYHDWECIFILYQVGEEKVGLY